MDRGTWWATVHGVAKSQTLSKGPRELPHYPHREDTARRRSSMNQEAGSHQTLDLPAS